MTIGAESSPRRDEIVERDAEPRALALPEPADARRQSLKLDPLLRERDPATQMLVVRKQLEHQLVGARDVLRIAGERDPAERSLPLAEERPDVLGDESGNVERVAQAGVERDRANVVAVVERHRAALLQLEHRRHVTNRGSRRSPHVLVGIRLSQLQRVGRASSRPARSRSACRARSSDR